MCTHVLSWVQLSATPWPVARQAPLSTGFFQARILGCLPFPPPRDLPDPGVIPHSPPVSCVSCIGRRILFHWRVYSMGLDKRTNSQPPFGVGLQQGLSCPVSLTPTGQDQAWFRAKEGVLLSSEGGEVHSNESTLCMRWPKNWSFSFSIIPSKEIPGLIFRMDWLDLLAVQGTLKSLLQHHSSKASILQPLALS